MLSKVAGDSVASLRDLRLDSAAVRFLPAAVGDEAPPAEAAAEDAPAAAAAAADLFRARKSSILSSAMSFSDEP
jgi:hypothetical protein